MISVGQALGGIVGGAIGFFVGNPILGAQIGLTLGGLLDPPKVQGPRLQDLSAQTSTYGAFIPRLHGTVAVTGNVFWIQGDRLIERSVDSGGKGGPSVTEFEYAATFAVGLCEGPIDGIRRIWIAGQLWYDAGSDDLATIIASNEAASTFTLYTGTDTQAADPLIQADRGAANVPAYRGLAYIVFEELPLKDYGNSLVQAQVKVEIINSSTVLPPRLVAAADVDGYPVTYYPRPVYEIGDGVIWFYGHNPSAYTSIIDGESVANVEALLGMDVSGNYIGQRDVPADVLRPQFSSSGLNTTRIGLLDGSYVWWPEYSGNYAIQNGTREVLPWGIAGSRDTASVTADRGDIADALTGEAGRYIIGIAISRDGLRILITTGPISKGSFDLANRYFVLDTDLSIIASGTIADTSVGIWNVCNSTSLPQNAGTVLDNSGESGWTSSSNPGGGITARYFYIDSGGTMQVSAEINSGLVGVGNLATAYSDGLFYILARTDTLARLYCYTAHPTVTAELVLLSDVVQAECLQSDLLTASDIDVSELTDQVRGYRVSALAPLRGGIDQLRKAFLFDVIQHGYKIKFKKRGSASVATITEGELDAREAGAAPGVLVRNVREMDTVLPRQLTVNYIDAAREYDTNTAEESRE